MEGFEPYNQEAEAAFVGVFFRTGVGKRMHDSSGTAVFPQTKGALFSDSQPG